MDLWALINLVIQNGFLTVFACTVLYFMIKFSTVYLNKLTNKNNTCKIADDFLVKFVRAEVWYHSKWKLRHIESILIENNINTRKDEVTRKVRNALEERTMVYLEYFNTMHTNITRLGDVYGSVFEMEPFFQEVMDVVLRKYTIEDHKLEIVIKIKDIGEIMTYWQERANGKLEDELKRISANNK